MVYSNVEVVNYMEKSCFLDIYVECVHAITNGELIEAVSARDKEFHFQNWFQKRIEKLQIHYEASGRNSYPDFRIVESTEGFEVKGLAWPGRKKIMIAIAKFQQDFIMEGQYFMFLVDTLLIFQNIMSQETEKNNTL